MREFKLQRSISKRILQTRPPTPRGMKSALATVREAPHGKLWKKLSDIDWVTAENRWVAWFDALLKHIPPPADTELLWFEVPSDLNPALTSVSGFTRLGSKDEEYGMEDGRTWPVNADGSTNTLGLLELPELESWLTEVGWREEVFSQNADPLRPGVYALCHACAMLLVLNGLPKTRLWSRLSSTRGVAVMLGWAEGDATPLGLLTPTGWGSLPRIEPAVRDADPEELNPGSYRFDLGKYIRADGDMGWRDPRHGGTLLMDARFEDAGLIKKLLAAGADVQERDKKGANVLHLFGACELPILRLLLKSGADPRVMTKDGWSVVDCVLNDGRVTVDHLKLLLNAGAPLRHKQAPAESGLHAVAAHNIHERGRAVHLNRLIQFLVRRGLDINAPDPDGHSPLWRALIEHARELREHQRTLKVDPNPQGQWNYQHDRVAIMLLAAGADPNARLKLSTQRYIPSGGTPLMVRRYDDDTLVRALLKHGADPLARCAAGKTALDYAKAAAVDKTRIDRPGAAEVVAILDKALQRAERKAKLKLRTA